MVFVKATKGRSYFKRYQTKYTRRKECKTDYTARRQLVSQDKNKYNSPRYRLVVRVTNRDVITQVVYSTINGDRILASAYAHELKLFGAKAGFTNWAACYATGLLAARRLLTSMKLADKYNTQADVDKANAAPEGPRPFKALLDVGLARTTTGARVFGALKGAVDGGLNVPHSTKRFPGFNREKKELNSEVLRQRIFGLHVAEYIRTLQGEDADKASRLFSGYAKAGLNADGIEGMWKAVHAAIRKEPTKRSPKKAPVKDQKFKLKPKSDTKARINRKNQKRAQAKARNE
jgi:large subunit ribosomal protein L5e